MEQVTRCLYAESEVQRQWGNEFLPSGQENPWSLNEFRVPVSGSHNGALQNLFPKQDQNEQIWSNQAIQFRNKSMKVIQLGMEENKETNIWWQEEDSNDESFGYSSYEDSLCEQEKLAYAKKLAITDHMVAPHSVYNIFPNEFMPFYNEAHSPAFSDLGVRFGQGLPMVVPKQLSHSS